ncbi:flagellar hook protein FlgE [Halioglobus japonicus]|uniref:Flagellar hook protein FlgE n=1 Tax=Halioglobus japonicus TaxID=930805 RepID=A0AAP8MEN9_9GAMM|nr:flagellar hook protein FlgE [Halioglobus japonicus]AQA18082.1 flagellar hook protein FlgE [Halioglobus japonicus]PLW86074.1 flagellar hook protein FlgE [Halioglobus japonicus]GHD14623.1 flagellar hook protein FlgE [Halioglobus japonicus]
MGFSQALSGLNAAATNLDVIGNNVANSQTVGFKAGRTLFADVYAGAQAGLGVKVAAVQQTFTSGTLESTGRNLDVAISGSGFLRFDQNGQTVYSRNGQLNMDANGYIVNAQGARLTGFPDGKVGGDPEAIFIPSGGLEASATTSVSATLNLDAATLEIDRLGVPFDATDDSTYSYTSNVTIYDSQGNDYAATLYYTKTGDNTWEVRVGRDGEIATAAGTLNFDANGLLSSTAGLDSFEFSPGGGVTDLDMALQLDGTTQFGNDFELTALGQDGYTSGSLVGIAIDELGNVVGNYSNGQTRVISTLVIANFANAEGLEPVGDNAWAETTSSGQPIIGAPGVGLAGTVASGVVENSNVDLTRELVNLIIAQRNYQANTQTIKVQDEVLQSVVNLR